MLLHLTIIKHLKNKGILYLFLNVISICFFFVIYYYLSINEGIKNPWYYWFYFSSITQTTVGYSGIKTIQDVNDNNDSIEKHTDVSLLSIKSPLFKLCIMLQLFSILIIHSIFLSI